MNIREVPLKDVYVTVDGKSVDLSSILNGPSRLISFFEKQTIEETKRCGKAILVLCLYLTFNLVMAIFYSTLGIDIIKICFVIIHLLLSGWMYVLYRNVLEKEERGIYLQEILQKEIRKRKTK